MSQSQNFSLPTNIQDLVNIPCSLVASLSDCELPYEYTNHGKQIFSRANVFEDKADLRRQLDRDTRATFITAGVSQQNLERFASGSIASFASLSRQYK